MVDLARTCGHVGAWPRGSLRAQGLELYVDFAVDQALLNFDFYTAANLTRTTLDPGTLDFTAGALLK